MELPKFEYTTRPDLSAGLIDTNAVVRSRMALAAGLEKASEGLMAWREAERKVIVSNETNAGQLEVDDFLRSQAEAVTAVPLEKGKDGLMSDSWARNYRIGADKAFNDWAAKNKQLDPLSMRTLRDYYAKASQLGEFKLREEGRKSFIAHAENSIAAGVNARASNGDLKGALQLIDDGTALSATQRIKLNNDAYSVYFFSRFDKAQTSEELEQARSEMVQAIAEGGIALEPAQLRVLNSAYEIRKTPLQEKDDAAKAEGTRDYLIKQGFNDEQARQWIMGNLKGEQEKAALGAWDYYQAHRAKNDELASKDKYDKARLALAQGLSLKQLYDQGLMEGMPDAHRAAIHNEHDAKADELRREQAALGSTQAAAEKDAIAGQREEFKAHYLANPDELIALPEKALNEMRMTVGNTVVDTLLTEKRKYADAADKVNLDEYELNGLYTTHGFTGTNKKPQRDLIEMAAKREIYDAQQVKRRPLTTAEKNAVVRRQFVNVIVNMKQNVFGTERRTQETLPWHEVKNKSAIAIPESALPALLKKFRAAGVENPSAQELLELYVEELGKRP